MLQEQTMTEAIKQTIRTILVVVEVEESGHFYSRAFSSLPAYFVCMARNSSHALHVVTFIRPSLWILDFPRSPQHGIALYDQLQALPQLAHTPCILVSAASSKEVQPYLQTRKLNFIEKPFDLDVFLHTVQQVLAEL